MKPLLNSIKTILTGRKEKIAIAESVTGGDVQSIFSLAEDALSFFEGGMTVYNIHQKIRHLHVDPVEALASNCVSEKVAAEMAVSVARLFHSDWGIADTGYASPVPEKGITDLYAWVAFSYKGSLLSTDKIVAPEKGPKNVRIYYRDQILQLFLRVITSISYEKEIKKEQ